ncbi:MAG: hypothetical protein U1F23_12810 [Lysobacterales bacterium]
MRTGLIVLVMAIAFVAGTAVGVEPASGAAESGGWAVVDYAALEHRIGDEVRVETTYGTVRTGVLQQYTKPALTLRLDAAGGIDLTVPKETVRKIEVRPHARNASAPAAGTAGAEKN